MWLTVLVGRESQQKDRENKMAAIKNITKFRNALAKAGVPVNTANGYQSSLRVTVRDYDFFDADLNEVSHYAAKFDGAEPVWFTMFNITPEQQVKLFDAGFEMRLIKMRKHFGAAGEFVMETVYQAPTK